MIEQIISYLEKLGYTVEEQGNLAKYLVVFKAGRPIGFVFPDLTVKLVTGTGEQDNIEKIIDFINQNKGLESAGKSEFLLASFRGNQLTTFFDVKSMCAKYASYIVGNTGETKSIIYENHSKAIFCASMASCKLLSLLSVLLESKYENSSLATEEITGIARNAG